MSKFTTVTTTGPVRWARVFEENRDLHGYQGQAEVTEGEYSILQILSQEEYQKLVNANSQKRPKQKLLLNEQLIGIQFTRPHKVQLSDGTIITKAGGQPVVKHPDGTAWDFEEDGTIGNDSVCEVKSLISRGKTHDGETYHRTSLMEVTVLEHVVFEPEEEAA